MTSPTVDRRLGLVGNSALKAPALVAATTNITLSGEQTIDGESVLAVNASSVPDRVLLTGQTDGTENGIWDVSTAAWTRAVDAAGPYDFQKGTTVFVTDGTVNHGTYWQITSDGPITIGTTSLTWESVLASVNAAVAAAEASADAAADSATAAETAETNAETAETNAETAEAAAEEARDAALAAALIFASTAKGLSKGVASYSSLVAGSGGTNGTFDLAFTGGAGSGAAGRFVVAGGAVTSIVITATGDSYTSAPAISFAASAGLTGASATAVIANNTDSGEYFYVPSAETDESLILYKNNAGAAVEVKRYPSALALAALLLRAPVGYAFSIPDAVGLAAAGLKDDGTFAAEAIEVETINDLPAGMLTSGAANKSGTYLAEINHLLGYGQSLALGQEGYYVQTDSQDYDSLMFTAGMMAVNGAGSQAANHAALIPLVEAYVIGSTARMGESPMGNMAATVKRLIADENNMAYTEQSYQLLASVTAIGNTSISNLSKPSTGFTNTLADVSYGMAAAVALGKTYNVPAVYWTHGERDIFDGTSYATYLAKLLQLYTDLNTDIKALTGQSNDIYLIIDQCSDNVTVTPSTNVALAQLQASKTNAKIVLACPTYPFPYSVAGQAHKTGPSYGRIGAHYGVAYKRTLIDGEKFVPVQPTSTVRQGAIVLVRFNVPVRPLVLDADLFSGATTSGFSLVDNVGAAMTINSVSVIAPDTVKIVASATVPAGSKVRYGFTSYGGNLRDSQGDYIDAGIKQEMPLHNPCVTFEETLA